MEKESRAIFDNTVVEFATVAAEYCAFLERIDSMNRNLFVDKVILLLPLMYVKASLLSKFKTIGFGNIETYVTEEMYETLRSKIAKLMGEKDDYLEIFLPDMAFSEEPITREISEDLTDIYQDIKDFIFVFRQGLNETMNDSLARCQENFASIWGQKLVNVMRALHNVKYSQDDEEEEDTDILDNNTDKDELSEE